MAYEEINLNFKGYRRKVKISTLPEISAIYGVYTCTYDKKAGSVSLKKLIYIGEAQNLRKRIANHEKWEDWESHLNSNEIICFNYAKIDDLRERAEAAMIYRHKPPENTEYADNFPFDKTKITTDGQNALMTKTFTVERDD